MTSLVISVRIMNVPRIKRVSVSKTPRYLSPASARCWTFVFTLNNMSPELTGAGEVIDNVHVHRIDQRPRCNP